MHLARVRNPKCYGAASTVVRDRAKELPKLPRG